MERINRMAFADSKEERGGPPLKDLSLDKLNKVVVRINRKQGRAYNRLKLEPWEDDEKQNVGNSVT
jgi:hypothetical protein